MDAQTSYFCAALDAAAEQVRENIPVFGKEFPLPCTRNGAGHFLCNFFRFMGSVFEKLSALKGCGLCCFRVRVMVY